MTLQPISAHKAQMHVALASRAELTKEHALPRVSADTATTSQASASNSGMRCCKEWVVSQDRRVWRAKLAWLTGVLLVRRGMQAGQTMRPPGCGRRLGEGEGQRAPCRRPQAPRILALVRHPQERMAGCSSLPCY